MKPNFTWLVSGGTGSGKTNTAFWTIKKHYIDKGIFKKENIYIFSPTADIDPLVKILRIPKLNTITDNIVEKVSELVEEQNEKVRQTSYKESPRVLFIMEDSTDQKDLLASQSLIVAFCRARHIRISTVIITHRYKALNRTCRLNCNYISIFKCNNSESEQIIEDFGVRLPDMKKSERKRVLEAMIDGAFEKEKDFEKPFLFINNKNPERRFNKGFHDDITPK